MNPKDSFHINLKYYRTKNGLSQGDLAEKLHLSRQTISSWESGRTDPGIENLVLLSNIFGISVDDLLKEPQQKATEVFGIKKDNNLIMESLCLAVLLLIASQFALTGMITSVVIFIWLRKHKKPGILIYLFCILCFVICLGNLFTCIEHFYNISRSYIEPL